MIPALLCLGLLCGLLPADAKTLDPVSTGVKIENLLPAGPGPLSLERTRERSGLDAFDKTPLENRIPLILIHGIGGNASRLFNWENFLTYVSTQPDFQAKYKIYLYHYNSSLSVATVSRDLQITLKGFVHMLGDRQVKILAYSEGGLLARNALQDPYLDEHTQEVLTIATPFHGSPLANPEWIQAQVSTESAFSPVRWGQKIAYKITRHKYPSFRQDFQWDNFDGAIPANLSSLPTTAHPKYALANKANFVTYGSYFGKELNPQMLLQTLDLHAPPPRERTMPSNLFRKNVLFSMIRNNIARLPLAIRLTPSRTEGKPEQSPGQPVDPQESPQESLHDTPGVMLALAQPHASAEKFPRKTITAKAIIHKKTMEDTDARPTSASMMAYNDGISPISSTLWLGRYMPGYNAGAVIPLDRLWNVLKSLKGNNRARLFAGLDHRNWMDGTTRSREPLIRDLLNPDEPPRSVFAWIVYDLMS